MISKHHNNEYDATSPNGVPDAAGDRYYAQDLFRDFHYLIDRLGLSFKDLIKHIPFKIEGGAVVQGTGATLDITAGFGYVKFSVQTVLSYASSPPTTQDEDIEAIRVSWTAQNDMALPSYTTGGAINYVKVAYTELDGTTRSRAKKAGSYSYDQSPSYVFSVDTTPPTDYEICLATFTEAAGVFTITSGYYPFLEPTHQAGELVPVRNLLVSNWTERSNPKNFELTTVCWSPDLALFCAVGGPDGTDAYLITSPDGITWTERSNPKNFDLYGISWSSDLSLFVAVGGADGTDAYLITSPDGITWTERSNPKNFNLVAVCWSPDLSLFCAVGGADGTDAYLITSPDGITWTERSNPKNFVLFAVCWSSSLSLFVAVGNPDGTDAYIITSPDGITWTERPNSRNFGLTAVCWSPDLSLFCAGGAAYGSGAYLLTSSDGITWTERSNPKNLSIYGISWSPDLSLFVAVGLTIGTEDAYLITSPDGITWTERNSLELFNLNGIDWSPELKLFVSVGEADGTDAIMITSLFT